MRLFGYPEVGRYGLGHGLLAWARCVVWCQKTGATLLAPNWLKIRIGPYLRQERDKREYFKLFHSGSAIGFPDREFRLLTAQKIEGEDGYFKQDIMSSDFLTSIQASKSAVVIVFENAYAGNENKHFSDVFGHSILLHDRLLAMTRDQYKPTGIAQRKIAIHVRLGDFSTSPNSSGSPRNLRQPIDWYCAALGELRAALGQPTPAIVFSDGSDDELASLLSMVNVHRAPRQESVTDMLSIAQASILIASGSGFSLWGAFLGQVPSVFMPGRKSVPFLDMPSLEQDWAEGVQLNKQFMTAINQRISEC